MALRPGLSDVQTIPPSWPGLAWLGLAWPSLAVKPAEPMRGASWPTCEIDIEGVCNCAMNSALEAAERKSAFDKLLQSGS